MKHLFVPVLVILLFNFSCKKDSAVMPVDVYVAGTANGATLWKNDVATTLPGNRSVANQVFVNGNDVYVTGTTLSSDGTLNAVYWKNGALTTLGKGTGMGIYVLNDDVYVAGFFANNPDFYDAAIWKNGRLTDLGPGQAFAITISGNDVYVAGYSIGNANTPIASYWKNGMLTTLGGGEGDGIAVQGSDVYVSGYSNVLINGIYSGCYWKNGVINQVGSQIYDLHVSGNTIYMAGTLTKGDVTFAAYWKNGTPTLLDQFAMATSVAVSGNDIYVTESLNDGPTDRHSA
ncbi:MAG: hypothetical protein JSU01_07510, partial [Bacteroidetes bacterium]|nr:hypothetical protein [Bacteroidota bacterium]